MAVLNCVASVCVWLAISLAGAQPLLPDLSVERAKPEDQAQRAEDAAAVYTLVSGGYAKRQVEERIVIGVHGPDEKVTTSEVVWRFVPGTPMERIVRMELGPLRIYAQGARLVAVHAMNPGTYAEFELAEGVTAPSLRAVLPPLPFPQAAWALDDRGPGGVGQVLAETKWTDLRLMDVGPCNVDLRGEHSGGPVSAAMPRGALPWAPVCTWAMPAGPGSPLRLSLMCERLGRSDPATWAIPTEGRTRVTSLADLKAVEPPVAIGQRVPALGLMTADLTSWALAEALESQSDGPLNEANRNRPVDSFAVLILARVGQPGAMAAAESAREAAAQLRNDLDRRRHLGRTTLPRCFVRVARVGDLADISDPAGERAKAAAQPLPTSEPSAVPLFTAGGKSLMDSFVPGASVVVVVIGADEKLAAAIPIDAGSAFDAAAFSKRLRDAVVGPHDVDDAAEAPAGK